MNSGPVRTHGHRTDLVTTLYFCVQLEVQVQNDKSMIRMQLVKKIRGSKVSCVSTQ